MLNRLYDGPLPTLPIIRRVPRRYHHILPLPLMKRFQCLVIGEGRGVLTVAISDARKVEVITSLEAFTGRRIFVVLVSPANMRLLISRIERCERQYCAEALWRSWYLHSLTLHTFINYLWDQQLPPPR